ncbi:hypothetical protein [Saccharopolyspora spinosa]|uniref:Uncharacterized protein n=1 Tax=Saccharopolyspora spinosa TaxID=60894 RepID=A0A2N3XWM1_SACSN|nr:hypothetical protein [Saccharopolyspora spinosa]PKW15077.1 hypothetical protein A8926_2756 [Saccharopolyspora spinosa]
MTTAKVLKLVPGNNVAHYVQHGADAALCGVPLGSLAEIDPCRRVPAPCSLCPSELARLKKRVVLAG